MILKVEDLTFKYNSHATLENVNFTVKKGEITVILGPNGVGKTTLLKCINSILSPLKGDILIHGKSIRDMDTMTIAKKMSYVSQQSQAARITAFDAILMGRRPHIRWRVSDNDIKMVDAAVKRLGLEHLAMKYTDQMSGGELQKVSIARALVQQTDLLLLDEPTSSLDMKNQIDILSLIKRVVKEHNIAAVMTMHDLNTALRYADKYIFLKNGSIFGAGDVKEITSKMVESVYGIFVEILHHNGNPVIIPDDGLKAA
ncbi:MAG: iron ABC transporter ATP-binding protein [Desulfobacteraceae bacterium 4572_89]|nr:MAG: iron ABC transporter ATP-binding protein [Desulfobacteraceae bacterium 4572_89]